MSLRPWLQKVVSSLEEFPFQERREIRMPGHAVRRKWFPAGDDECQKGNYQGVETHK